MAEVKITALPAYADPASTDVLPIVDVVADLTKKVSIADLLENAGTGSASAPAFAFDADPNTGMYLSGADALAFSTGGTGRLFIDSSGRVGIGTTSPQNNLHLSSSSAVTRFQITNSTTAEGSSDGTALIQTGNTFLINNRENDDIYFATNNSEAMRIDSSGRVGIGTSSPAPAVGNGATLHLYGSQTTSELRLERGNGTDLSITAGSSSGGGGIMLDNKFSISTDSNFSQALTIDTSGNVGIGTTSPGQVLDVLGDAQIGPLSGTSILYLGTRGFSSSFKYNAATGNLDIAPRGGYGITFQSNTAGTTEFGRWDSSGRLLVGTSSSSQNIGLVIQGNSGGTDGSALFANTSSTPSGGTALGALKFSDAGQVPAVQIISRRDGGTWTSGTSHPSRLEFSTTADGASSPTERMRIDSTGSLISFTDNNSLIRSARTASTDSVFTIQTGSTNIGNGITRFRVMGDGDAENTNNSYTGISDIKLKENIADANSQWSDIKALQVRYYNFKEETNYGTHTQIGLVAQEVETVSPGLVKERNDVDENGNDLGTVTKSVNYSVLYMKAVKALQEAMERIEQLEQRLTDAGL